ncbi:amino acid permease [Candidatus Margulisiibacteriota bacterium]
MRLKKDLGLLEVFCISSGAMISSGLFILPALAYLKTGPSLILSYALAAILVLPTIFAKAELVTALPRTGGIFVFTDRAMGPIMGTLAGIAAWFSLAFKTAFALLGMGIFIVLLYPGVTLIQIKIIAIICCIFFTVINLIGVKDTGKLQVYMVAILLGILIFYIASGIPYVKPSHFVPFTTMGIKGIITTAGFVFISYAGTSKIAAVAGEVKNPDKNLPLGMLMSWGIVSLLYIGIIFVMSGVITHDSLLNCLTPLSLTGGIILGPFGTIIMTIAALLAFITTANAGILAASRDPAAMSKDELLPNWFSKISERGVPSLSILFTSGFMIVVILFLDLEIFIKTASTLKLILFIIANLALIFFRYNANVKHYHPAFKAPLFPWLQIVGIAGYLFLIYEMGLVPISITLAFIIAGLGWHYLFAHKKLKKEYELLRLIKKVTETKYSDYLYFEETRELLITENAKAEANFEDKLKNCLTLEITKKLTFHQFYKLLAESLAPKLQIEVPELRKQLKHKDKHLHIVVRNSTAVIFEHIKKPHQFEIALIRSKKPVCVSKKLKPVNNIIVVAASVSKEHYYLFALKWFFQLLGNPEFLKEWHNEKIDKTLCQIIAFYWGSIRKNHIA